MLKHYSYGIKRSIIAIDIFILVLAYRVSTFIRYGPGSAEAGKLIWVLLASAVVIPLCYSIYGIYDFRHKTFLQCANKMLLAHMMNFMCIALISYLWRVQHFSRLFMAGFLSLSIIMHVLSHLCTKGILSRLRARGFNYRRTLIVGCSQEASRIISSIEENVQWGLRIDGIIREDEQDTADCRPSIFEKYPVLGDFKDLKNILMNHVVDNVIFCPVRKQITELKNIILDIEAMGISSHVAIPNPTVRVSSTFLGNIDGIPLITYCPVKLSPLDLMIKNLIDIVGGVVGFFIFLVLYPVIGLAIKLESSGPVLFKQQRIGENGRIFTLYKFRSMYQDAEERKKELLEQNQLQGAVFKIADDPRITRVGKFLRRFSLDEWPQFINVLRREMSLIGTRPPTMDEVEQYDLWHKRRLSMKPGLTGLWQVSGRNQITDFNEIVKLDLKYIDNWSIWYDFFIMIKTLLVALRREGAY